MQKWRLVVLLVAVAAGSASAEKVGYRIVALDTPQTPIAEGERMYAPDRDVTVKEAKTGKRTIFWSKRLLLASGFWLEAHVTREPALDGFGLVITDPEHRGEFSWNWFDRDGPDHFVKRRGAGQLTVRVRSVGSLVELDTIEFLDDVVVTYKRTLQGPYTHEVQIKKGSIFRMAR